MLFETVVSVASPLHELRIGAGGDEDGLGFLAGRRLSEVNRMAEAGVALAHCDGGVPNLRVDIDRVDAYGVGGLLYFFERACGISGYLLGYKRNMYALLDKPGYEEEGRRLRERLKER